MIAILFGDHSVYVIFESYFMYVPYISLYELGLNLRLSCFIPLERRGLYRLSPFPSLSVKILNAEFAVKLIITTNFEVLVFSCCWKCLQHQLCFVSSRTFYNFGHHPIQNPYSATAHDECIKVFCVNI